MTLFRPGFFFSLLTGFLLFPAVQALASAPQVIALIATNSAVPLICHGRECSAEFSSYCLQKWRASPPPGKVYHPRGGEGLTVTAVTKAGETVTLADTGDLRITAHRGHSAMKISVPARLMGERGYASLSVQVGKKVSLVPDPVIGDKNPLTEQDIALAIGPLRDAGDRIVEGERQQVAAAGILSGISSRLTRSSHPDAGAMEALWRQASAGTGDSEALATARTRFESCARASQTGILPLQQCLGSRHDILVGHLNNRYWDAVTTGW